MANVIKFQGFAFYIEPLVEYVGVPEQQNIVTPLDLSATIVSLERLPGENIIDFKRRIMDVAVHPESSTYDGVINGLTRAFGYLRTKAINITLNTDSSGEYLARNPRVDVLANKVILYSDYRPDGTAIIDKTIKTYQPDDEGYFLDDLVAEINLSTCFAATIYEDVRPNTHSTNLICGNSDLYVQGDPVRTDRLTYLSAQHIVEGSMIFNEPDVFSNEVNIIPVDPGDYMIDRTEGKLYSASIPSGLYGVTYHASLFPFDIDYSPIKVYTLQDDNFQYELFQHKTLDSGEEVNSLPNTEGSEIYHQLFKETEMFWGI
jgi:hypothetical protein